ncbi:sugar ABC transporter substrate-binding protein [candidate division KSB1 bacterium]|nr:sugar ABC transporter substrate-binding protein [candidate division KSB1 bacterium]
MHIFKATCWFVLGLLLFMLSCAPGDSPGDRQVIRFMFWGGFKDMSIWREMKRLYEAKYPDRFIKLELVAGRYEDKLSLSFIGGKAADVIMLDDDHFKMNAFSGNLLELTSYINRDREQLELNDFFKNSLEAFQLGGKQYGMPWDCFSVILFYNKDLFDKYNLKYPSENYTWDDLLHAAQTMTRDLDGDGYRDQFGFNFGLSRLNLTPIMWTFGGGLLTKDWEYSALGTPESRQAIDFIRDMLYKYEICPRSEDMADMNDYIMLLTGRVGIIMSGAYTIDHIRSIGQGMAWDIAPLPTGPAGTFSRAAFDGLGINAQSTVKQEAWDFIKIVLSSQGQEFLGRRAKSVPIKISDAMTYYVRSDTPQNEEIVIQGLQNCGRTMPQIVAQGNLALLVGQHFQEIMMPDADVSKEIKLADEAINKLLKEVREKYPTWK